MRICALLALLATAANSAVAQSEPRPPAPALQAFARLNESNSDAAKRRATFRGLIKSPALRDDLARLLERRLDELEAQYAACLRAPVRAAYRARFATLGRADRYRVAKTRRLWRQWLLRRATQTQFQRFFLAPATKLGGLLFPDVSRLQTKESKALRRMLAEFHGYRTRVRTALGLGEDPTSGVVASTGVAFPPLTRVRKPDEQLTHLDRTIAVAASVAPVGAWNILIENAHKARHIDFEEAEFVLYANEIRMLMGTVAWAIDVAACACTRDHSIDRAAGRAKGHWSSVPGKKGMGDRLRRFGTSARSEGAGGGANGRGYLWGLSYGGGHTGPLYSFERNVVGVGRSGGVYTSVYRGDERRRHGCHVLDDELFMPPGFTKEDVEQTELAPVYERLRKRDFAAARSLAKAVKATSSIDKALLAYLRAMIQVEADWRIECLSRIEAAGDSHGVAKRIERARSEFGKPFEKRLARFERRLRGKAGREAVAAGESYARACANGDDAVRRFVAADPGSVYGKAAKAYLSSDKKHPLAWFLTIDKELNRFEFLVDAK